MSTAPNAAPSRVLLADDQPDVLMALRLLLKGEGFLTEAVSMPAEVVQMASSQPFDLILMDMNYTRDTTSGDEGLELLGQLKELPQAPPAIVMTAWSSIDLAVEAMRRGAVDFVTKPWDNTRLVQTLRKNIRLRQEALNHDDLAIARKVQGKLFPQTFPALSTLEYRGLCVEAGAVGGDFYDFFDFGRGRLGLVLADVCGKGMGAALLMANLQATLRSHFEEMQSDWVSYLPSVNAHFYRSTAPEHFATAFLAEYDDATRQLRYANCGHNPPLILRRDGRLERLQPTALVLGAFRRFTAQSGSTVLEPGDWFIAYSDGVVEAMNHAGEMYGESALAQVIRTRASDSLEEMIAAVRSSLDSFAAAAGRDDWTLIAARCRG